LTYNFETLPDQDMLRLDNQQAAFNKALFSRSVGYSRNPSYIVRLFNVTVMANSGV